MPFVRDYVRSDGTPVRGHSRSAPGARRELTILAVVALAVVGFGHNNAHADRPARPRPGSTGAYPIRFDQLTGNPPKAAVPQPTVSYPIKFKTPKAKTAKPRPTVSYPIDFSTMGGGR